jgi:hypothetical protein
MAWKKLFCIGTLAVFTLSGCVTTFRDFPAEKLGGPHPQKMQNTLQYKVTKPQILDFGGTERMRTYFKRDTPFASTEEAAATPPAKGLFVDTRIDWKMPSTPSMIFGYISAVTLTIIPMWSTKDGYTITFDVYRDGAKVQTYPYEITRKFGAWILLLPFIWVNLATYDETQAFEAVANKFFDDAAPVLGLSK